MIYHCQKHQVYLGVHPKIPRLTVYDVVGKGLLERVADVTNSAKQQLVSSRLPPMWTVGEDIIDYIYITWIIYNIDYIYIYVKNMDYISLINWLSL